LHPWVASRSLGIAPPLPVQLPVSPPPPPAPTPTQEADAVQFNPFREFMDVIANRADRRERETEICGAPLRLQTVGDFNYWQDLLTADESGLDGEEEAILASDDAFDFISEALHAIPPPPEYAEYERVGSTAPLADTAPQNATTAPANTATQDATTAPADTPPQDAAAAPADTAPPADSGLAPLLGVPPPTVTRINENGQLVLRMSDEDHDWLMTGPGLELMGRVMLELAGRGPRQAYGIRGSQEAREAEVRRRELILVFLGAK